MNTKFEIIEGFPTYKDVLNSYTELMEKVKNITTIEQAEQYQKENSNNGRIEINGELIEQFISKCGTNNNIEWIRYENYKCLDYVYCYIKNKKIANVFFGIYCTIFDSEFIESTNSLTQETYYLEVKRIANRHLSKGNIKCIGYDTEVLPDINFNLINTDELKMNEQKANSICYNIYLLLLKHNSDIEQLQKIKKKFDLFYKLIDEEKFNECKVILQELTDYLGEYNNEVFRARSVLEYEMN